MKCLTICQPYASSIMCGIKRVENRDWPTKHRGPLVIHAGKSRDWLDSYDGRQEEEMRKAGFKFDEDGQLIVTRPELFGSILGVVDLVDCLTLEDYTRKHLDPYFPGGEHDPWAFGPWCWLLRNPRRLPAPVPHRGQQGLFEVSYNLVCEVL